jgi:hypothetical protein
MIAGPRVMMMMMISVQFSYTFTSNQLHKRKHPCRGPGERRDPPHTPRQVTPGTPVQGGLATAACPKARVKSAGTAPTPPHCIETQHRGANTAPRTSLQAHCQASKAWHAEAQPDYTAKQLLVQGLWSAGRCTCKGTTRSTRRGATSLLGGTPRQRQQSQPAFAAAGTTTW